MMIDPADLKRARRIVILARSNGFSGLLMGTLALIIAAIARDPFAIAACCGICAAAAVEIKGANQASRHEAIATRFLVASQLLSIGFLLALVTRCAIAFSPSVALAWLPSSMRELVLILYPGPAEAAEFLRFGLRVALGLVASVAVLYQGGMAIFYQLSESTFARLGAAKLRKG